MNSRGILLLLLVGVSAHLPAWGQPKIGKIDVTLMLESLPTALEIREKFHETKAEARKALEMQLGGIIVAAYPEVQTTQEGEREPFVIFFPKFKTEVKRRYVELHSWLMVTEAAMLQPLMEKVDSVIESVRLELQLDTILRTEGCPFDLWAYERFMHLNGRSYPNWSISGRGWSSYHIAAPNKEPCLRLGLVLATAPGVMDIAPIVLEKLEQH